MEITGTVTKVTTTYIRVKTIKKKQEIDIFYTESREKAVFYRFQEHIVTKIEVEPEEVDVNGVKLAKLWLNYVITPEKLNPKDYSSRISGSPAEITSILYKKNA